MNVLVGEVEPLAIDVLVSKEVVITLFCCMAVIKPSAQRNGVDEGELDPEGSHARWDIVCSSNLVTHGGLEHVDHAGAST